MMIMKIQQKLQQLIKLCQLKNAKSEMDDRQNPSQLKIWKFYLKNLKIDLKVLLHVNLTLVMCSFISLRKQSVLIAIKNDLVENYENNISNLIQHIGELLFYSVIILLVNYSTYRIQRYYLSQLSSLMETQIVGHLLSLDTEYFEEKKVSQIISDISEGVVTIVNEFEYNGLIYTINQYITHAGIVYVLYTISPFIALTIFAVCFIFAILELYLDTLISQVTHNLDLQNHYSTFAFDDIIQNIFVVKGFGKEQKEIDALQKIAKQNDAIRQQYTFLTLIKDMIFGIRLDILIIIIIYQLYRMRYSSTSNTTSIIQNQTEIIDSTYSCIFLVQYFIQTILSKQNINRTSSKISISKIMQIFESKSSIYSNNDDDRKIVCLNGDISFENVYFKYPKINDKLAEMNQKISRKESEKKRVQNNEKLGFFENLSTIGESDEIDKQKSVITNLSFKIKQGQFVSFVGKSGSGKSTITKLIHRLYDTNEGNVIINGQNIKDISHKNLKQSIGYVSQEPTLLDNDIEYNIAYGCLNDEYTQEEMKRACDISGVSEFVFDKKRFPDGLKTLIGANGIKLSGGQKQRVALARALIKNPSILILDEATSSLDAESEYVVQKYIDGIVEKRGMTIIVIAHRLSTIIKSDTIFVMEHGQIKEQGTHQQLISENAFYKKLVSRQIQFTSKENIF